jgi:hypothetical protein
VIDEFHGMRGFVGIAGPRWPCAPEQPQSELARPINALAAAMFRRFAGRGWVSAGLRITKKIRIQKTADLGRVFSVSP